MRFPEWLPVFGDVSFRGKCPRETVEQITFLNRLRGAYPDTWGRLVLHPANEGKRHYKRAQMDKADGSIQPGASDIVIPARRAFVCEIKRQDHTQSVWQPGQIEYLEAAMNSGAWVCVGLGAEGATMALNKWMEETQE